MGRHLRLARRLHLGARRRERCRSGRIFCRDRVRYAPSVQRIPTPPTPLPLPVRGHPLRRPRVDPVRAPVGLDSTPGRAPATARAHRRARTAEDAHTSAPATSPESPVHAPLLVGAAGRLLPPAAPFHAAARVHAPAAKARVVKTRAFTFSIPRLYAIPDAPPSNASDARRAANRPSTGAHRFSVSPPRPPLLPPAQVSVARAICAAVTTTTSGSPGRETASSTTPPPVPPVTTLHDQAGETSSPSGDLWRSLTRACVIG